MNIRTERDRLGLTRAELSRLSRVSDGVIKRAEEGKPIRNASMDAIVAALKGQEPTPIKIVETPAPVDPVQKAVGDLVVALRDRILGDVDAIVEEKLRARLLSLAGDPLTKYLPTPDTLSPEIAPPQTVVSHGLPEVYAPTGWKIVYPRRFIKDLDGMGGARGMATTAIIKFASHGEQHSGTNFKKLQVLMDTKNPAQFGHAEYAFRINRRWRILVRKDAAEKTYTLTRIVHHDEIE